MCLTTAHIRPTTQNGQILNVQSKIIRQNRPSTTEYFNRKRQTTTLLVRNNDNKILNDLNGNKRSNSDENNKLQTD